MKRLSLPVVVIAAVLIFSGTVYAQYSSNNYKANEVFFGSGGDPNQSSANYKANASIGGGFASGLTSSAAYQAFIGFLTPNEPFLELQIDSGPTVNLGTLDTTTTRTGTAQFHVRAYIDSGYSVITTSQPPTYSSGGGGSHTLTGMSLGGSSIGVEQFGINLRANTSPASFGSDPSPQPNSSYAFGQAASGYNTVNQYKYSAGDTIACSGTSGSCGSATGWGQTNYTISYIANISPVTPAGSYSMLQDLVAVATF